MIRHWFLKSVNVLLLYSLFSCASEYDKMEKRELDSGRITNNLFLGLELGMDRKAFYDSCTKMNKAGILLDGPTDLMVEYEPTMPSGKPAKMRFYPKYENNKIYLMQVEFSYDGWAPWNEDLTAEKLREDVVALFEEWYGPGFIEVTSEDKSQVVFVKVDGNRRIRIFKKHISTVRVEISDLPVEKKIKENANS